MRVLLLGATLLLVPTLLACSGSSATEVVLDTSPEALGGQDCAVCGMTVREQPAPRGQALHKDGTRLWFCSLGDLRAHLDVRSPHGKVVGTWVEDMQGAPTESVTEAAQPWTDAESSAYVVGFSRPTVMGPPTLSYAAEGPARQAAEAVGGHVVDWTELRAVPANEVPAKP